MKKVFSVFIIAFLFSGIIQAQEKITLNVKDLNSDIEKYIKKNYKDYKTVEAFKYDVLYEMKTQKGDASEWLLFDKKGKFLNKETGSRKEKMPSQIRTTMATKDVSSAITKYIKNTGYKLTESYMYDESTEVKIMKGSDAPTLLFDKDGKFVAKVVAPAPAVQPKKADTVPAKKGEPKKDTVKKK